MLPRTLQIHLVTRNDVLIIYNIASYFGDDLKMVFIVFVWGRSNLKFFKSISLFIYKALFFVLTSLTDITYE
jgi:hypothetical protein